MKKLQKFTFYAVSIVILIVFGLYAFHFHPEVQILFFIPGIFLMIYSAFLSDFPNKARLARHGR